jgi:hypothetical protein
MGTTVVRHEARLLEVYLIAPMRAVVVVVVV